MYRTVLVGYEESDRAHDALALARMIASASGATLIVANVYPKQKFSIPPDQYAGWEQLQREESARILGTIEAGPAEVQTRIVGSSSPPHGLEELSREVDADLIVVGSSHGTVRGKILPGSTAQRLLHGSGCAIAVAPAGYADASPAESGVVAVAFDGSPEAEVAMHGAIEFARAGGDSVNLIDVAEVPPLVYGKGGGLEGGYLELKGTVEEIRKEDLDRIMASMPTDIELKTTLLDGDPAGQIAAASEGAKLLFIGSRGFGPLRQVMLGTVSGRLLRMASCPVIMHPRGIEEPE